MPENLHSSRQVLSSEIYQLLQLIPIAAIVIDVKREIIVNCNPSFTKLTGFSSSEILNRPINNLFQDSKMYSQVKSTPMIVELVFKDLNNHSEKVKFQYLDTQKQIGLLLIETPINSFLEEKVNSGFSILVDELAKSKDTVESWICACTDLFKSYLDVDYFAFYKVDPENKYLIKKCSVPKDDAYPHQLPISDFDRLAVPITWLPGKRVLTELHRFARMQNLAALATIGVVNDGQAVGLLVFSTQRHLSVNFDLTSMQLFKTFIEQRLSKETDRNLSEELHRRKDQDLAIYSQVFVNSLEGICIVDPQCKILQINPAAEWMLGYADWEVTGQQIDNLLIGPKNLADAFEQAKQGITTHNLGDAVLHHRDGHSFPVQIQVIPVCDKDLFSNLIVVFRDISEHEQIIARTQQLEHRALLGDVTSVFAHEVRNPINNISTGLQLVASRMNIEDPNRDVINRIQTDCIRLNDLMESVLAFSRPVDQKFEEIDLPGMLQKLIDRWHPRMSKSGIHSNLDVCDMIPLIKGNHRSLERVFINLISNAVDAMEKNGGLLAIKVSKEVDAGRHEVVKVSVADSGVGMPEEIQKRLFEPFVTNKQHGTGLGLAITKKIVTAHKGTIQVESFTGGTIFHVTIPVSNGAIG